MQSFREELKSLLERYKDSGHNNIPGVPVEINDHNIDRLTDFMMSEDKTDDVREKFMSGLNILVQRAEKIKESEK